MAQKLIAIDLSPGVARVVIIEASLRRAELVDVKTIPVDAGLAPAEIWPLIRAALPSTLDSVIVGLDARSASTRLLEFPFGDVRKAETAMNFELEGQIPYNIEDVATTWLVTDRQPAQIQLLAAIMPKAPLALHFAALSAAGIEARAAVLPAVALGEYVSEGHADTVALASLGASQSHLAISRGHLRFLRTLRAGGDDIDRALAKRFGVPLAQAREAKHTEGRILGAGETGSEEMQRISEALIEGLKPLLSGLVSTFKSLPAAEMPQRMLITGGLSRLPGLAAYLAQNLGVPVELLDLRESTRFLPGGPEAVGPEYAIALGMAIGLFRRGRDIPLNFRRGDLAYHGDIQLYRGQFTRLAVGLAAVFSLAIFASIIRYSMLGAEERQIDRGFCDATMHIVGREICDPTAALATLRQAPGAEGVTIPSFSASALLEMMSKAVSTDVDVQFDEIDLRVDATPGQPERVTGKGEAASFETTEQLTTMLRRDVCVQEAEVSKLRKTQTSGRVEFNVQLKVACPVGVLPGTQQAVVQAMAPAPGASAPAAPPPAPGAPPL